MSVLIGSARMNEFGVYEGGQDGDQTGVEVSTQDWYLHELGWYVIRAKSPEMRKKIAQDMRWACANDNIGYDMNNRAYTLTNEAKKYGYDVSKVNKPVSTNCAKLIRVCALYAGSTVRDFYTGNEVAAFRDTGEFDILTEDRYCKTDRNLLEGDILVTRSQGHTVAVLTDGIGDYDAEKYVVSNCNYANMRKGDNINFAVVATLKCGTDVELIGWSENGWGHIIYDDKVGYMSPKYLAEKMIAFGQASGNVWIRSDAGTNYQGLIVIPKGALVELTGATKLAGNGVEWRECIYNDVQGWASGRLLKPV